MNRTSFAIALAVCATVVACGNGEKSQHTTLATAAPVSHTGEFKPPAPGNAPSRTRVGVSVPTPSAVLPSPAFTASTSPTANATLPPPVTPAPLASVRPRPLSSAVPVLAPDAPPVITSYVLSSTTLRAGDVVTGAVVTSSNVASVEARIAGYSVVLTKAGVGHFHFAGTVPNLPGVLHRDYTLEFIARNTRGDATRQSVPISIR